MQTTVTAPNAMVLYVRPKDVYGEVKIYPACDRSELFARIAGTKTLTDATIACAKALGYSLQIVNQIIEL